MPDPEIAHQRVSRLAKQSRVHPGTTVRLARDFDPGSTGGLAHESAGEAQAALRHGVELLSEYQDRLAAQDSHALLVILQAIDAAGKDGTIKHVMSGVNPQGVEVHSFKRPSLEELDHDYLWRYAVKLPGRGKIGIFNRSHYEEVLVVRVHPELLEAQRLPPAGRGDGVWERRFRQINEWERYLVENGIHVVKLFLNVSKEAQRARFLERIERPEKNWKFSAADLTERGFWDRYQDAYSEVLSHTSTPWAPWHVIPADHKWFTRIAAAAVIAQALVDIDPRYPEVGAEARKALEAARAELSGDGGS